MNLCIVQPNQFTLTETFLLAQEQNLPARVTVLCGMRPKVKGESLSAFGRCRRMRVRAATRLGGKSRDWEATQLFRHAFSRHQPEVVLAQYGPTGVRVMEACHLERIPLVVQFHGVDAANREILRVHAQTYPKLFQQAAAVVAVSRRMTEELMSLGAPPDKLRYVPYGVNCTRFAAALPAKAPPTFLAVGRFVEKKAPHLTIMSFAEVHRHHREARLRMVGDGELLPSCRELVQRLRISHAVDFLGGQRHEVVRQEMQRARAFVQHSVVASCGDSEGTPVAIIEAGASGLPVVATRHAGIPDVVLHGETGLLVDEHDVTGMADHMKQLAEDPARAATLGGAARRRVRCYFSEEQSIGRLWAVIQKCAPRPANTAEPRPRSASPPRPSAA